MTIRIVSAPKLKETTCGKCKARLEYAYTDMVTSVERDYGGGSDKVSRITCPCCNSQVSVPTIF